MLEQLGNIGDFIGGIAVVATLIYLAIQIRQNTSTTEMATVQTAARAFTEVLETMAKDPLLMELYLSGCSRFDELDPVSRQRYSACMGMLLHRFEGLVELVDRGVLAPEAIEGGTNRLRGAFSQPGTLSWWRRGKHGFNGRLREWVEKEVIGKVEEPAIA